MLDGDERVAIVLLPTANPHETNWEYEMSRNNYGVWRDLPETSYEDAVDAITDALKEEGFGILTEIDVSATLKKKLDVDFQKYVILGACNPKLAHQALTGEEGIGLLLPCNVVVHEKGSGSTVGILDPLKMFSLVDGDGIEPIANDARERLVRALESI